MVLGAFEDFTYRQEEVDLAPGDLLVAFSDGVTDAESPTGQPFGDGRLQEILRDCRAKSARGILETVLESVATHVGEAPALDDITLVVLKRRS